MTNTLIITGASKGIGKACAQLFLAHGWHVINISRSSCTLPETINFNVDLNDSAALQQQKPALIDILGSTTRISLVHNAAAYHKDKINDLNPVRLQQSLGVGIVAPSILNQMILPLMADTSSIIYIGSTLSEKAVANAASYVITKHAVAGMMKATCQDLVGQGIHTCCICPGFTDTEMLRAHLNQDASILAALAETMSAKRLVQPEEIAQMVWFCAHNPVINGAMLHANLGQIEH